MAVAGKAAITMEGAWSSTKDYDRLCGVVHNNSLFISRKKPPIGVAPAENDYWMLCIEGVNEQDLDALAVRVTDIEAKYFPKAGGTLLGDMTIQKADNGQSKIFKNHSASADYGTEIADIAKDGRKSRLVLNASSGLPPQWYDKDGNGGSFYGVFNKPTANDVGALPISGGQINRDAVTVLILNNTNSNYDSFLKFASGGDGNGFVGFTKNKELMISLDGANLYNVFSEKNKPFGSYTGGTDYRTIDTGGIGRALLLYRAGSDEFSIITPQGGIVKESGGLSYIASMSASYVNGTLTIASNHRHINQVGATYYYQVI